MRHFPNISNALSMLVQQERKMNIPFDEFKVLVIYIVLMLTEAKVIKEELEVKGIERVDQVMEEGEALKFVHIVIGLGTQ